MNVTIVNSAEGGRALARGLLDPSRDKPWVVVSTKHGQTQPLVDATEIQATLGDLARVWVLVTGEASWAVTDLLPPRSEVYGGAGRAYPVDPAWQQDPYKSPLRFVWDPVDAGRAAAMITSDAEGMASRALRNASPPRARRKVIGVVEKVEDHAAVVRLDSGQGLVLGQNGFTGLPLPRVLRRSQRINAAVVEDGLFASLLVDPPDAEEAKNRVAAAYPPGTTVLCRVESATPDNVVVALHPMVLAVVEQDRDDPSITAQS